MSAETTVRSAMLSQFAQIEERLPGTKFAGSPAQSIKCIPDTTNGRTIWEVDMIGPRGTSVKIRAYDPGPLSPDECSLSVSIDGKISDDSTLSDLPFSSSHKLNTEYLNYVLHPKETGVMSALSQDRF